MKYLMILAALYLAAPAFISAQDHYLPASTTSEAAKAAYLEALRASEHADTPALFEGIHAAVKADPDFFMAYAYLALAQISFGQYEKAAPHFKSTLAIDAAGLNKSERILRKALQALDKEPKADIAAHMASLTEAYAQNTQAHELAAVTASRISKDPQAAAGYNLRLIELRPDHGGTYNALGYYYMALRQMEKAKAAFDKYLEASPDEANAYDSIGEYYMNTKDYTKSAEYYNKATEMGMEPAKERAEKARAALKKAGN